MRLFVFEMSTHIPNFEVPNRATQAEIEAIDSPTAPYGGEERFSIHLPDNNVFPNTGGTMKNFEAASKAVAQVLKNV